jgi:membrane associated rhomboid family serine protease
MLPLHDENPRSITPWVTYTLIIANAVAFAHQLTLPPGPLHHHLSTWGVVPQELLTAAQHPGAPSSPSEFLALLSSMFLHGGWLHIGGNMLFLHIFGDNIEDVLGHARYLLFYLACGVVAALAHVAAEPTSTVPTVGASGAISGILGAYLVLYPTARVVTLLTLGFVVTRVRVPALVFLGLWFGLQSVQGIMALTSHQAASAGGVAWFAHIGGFVAGAVVGLGIRATRQPSSTRPRRGR